MYSLDSLVILLYYCDMSFSNSFIKQNPPYISVSKLHQVFDWFKSNSISEKVVTADVLDKHIHIGTPAKYQIHAAFKFLGFIDDKNNLNSIISALGSNGSQRNFIDMKSVVRNAYKDLYALTDGKVFPSKAQLVDFIKYVYRTSDRVARPAAAVFVWLHETYVDSNRTLSKREQNSLYFVEKVTGYEENIAQPGTESHKVNFKLTQVDQTHQLKVGDISVTIPKNEYTDMLIISGKLKPLVDMLEQFAIRNK